MVKIIASRYTRKNPSAIVGHDRSLLTYLPTLHGGAAAVVSCRLFSLFPQVDDERIDRQVTVPASLNLLL